MNFVLRPGKSLTFVLSSGLYLESFTRALPGQNSETTYSVTSVPSGVRNLRKMRNFWANFTDFEPEINIIKCKSEKLKQKLKYFNARLWLVSWKSKFNAKNL